MSEVLLCNQALSPMSLQDQCGITIDQVTDFSCKKPSLIAPHTPYLIGNNTDINPSALAQLSPAPVARELTNLSLSYGGDNVLALASISAMLQDYNVGLMGSSTSVYANRIGGFAGSVKNYQAALMEYRQAVTSKSPMKVAAKQKAHMAFDRMQSQFRNELKAVTAQANAKRGTPLTSAERATNIAKSSRNAAKLNVSSQVQVNNLVKFSKHTKFLGNGLAVIDFGSRIGNIHNSYEAGSNWERDLFIESSSFSASVITGSSR